MSRINVEVEIGVAAEIARNRFVEREVFQAIEESGVGVQPQVTYSVACEIVVPSEQVFGEGVEVEGVGDTPGILLRLALPLVFELHREPRLAGAVVGVEEGEICTAKIIPQLSRECLEVGVLVDLRLGAHASTSSGERKSCCISPFLWVLRASSF